MTTNSLGALTLDLILQMAGFESGMDKAARVADRKTKEIERQAQQRAKAIEAAFKNMASAIAAPLAGAFSVSAITSYTTELVRTGKEITNLSRLANASAGEFQKLAYGANTVGVAQDKLADILKDTQDKIGDFLTTGGGPLKDFFEQIAPKVGVTAEQFRNLSGPQALQLFYSSLEKAKLSQSQMVFWMESLASDATLLQPLLRDNGRGFAELGNQAQRAGGIIGDDVLQASVELSKNWDSMTTQLRGAVIPVLGDIVKLMNEDIVPAFNGPVIQEALQSFSTMAKDTVAEVKGLFEFAQKFKQAHDIAFGNVQPQGTWEEPPATTTPPVVVTATPITTPTKTGKQSKSQYEPLADAARAYEGALQSLVRAQTDADTSGLNLSKTQADLLTLFQSPEWLQMPETWRAAVAEQASYTLAAGQAAAASQELNALLAATPTAQLEQQRSTMQFLAQAFEQGTISAQQFSEAATAALGNVPATAVENTTQKIIDMSLVANDAANRMASAFGDFFAGQDVSVKGMLSDFLGATAKMIAQAAILKAIQTAANSAGGGWGALLSKLFADGGAFGPGGQIKAFATGGVVDRPTLFKFASGGGFSTGVMGEAGPESIMPLKRGADGRLGVIAHGGGSMTVNQAFNITVEGSDDPNAGRRQGDMLGKELQRHVKSAVREVLVTEKRYGGLLA